MISTMPYTGFCSAAARFSTSVVATWSATIHHLEIPAPRRGYPIIRHPAKAFVNENDSPPNHFQYSPSRESGNDYRVEGSPISNDITTRGATPQACGPLC